MKYSIINSNKANKRLITFVKDGVDMKVLVFKGNKEELKETKERYGLTQRVSWGQE